MKQVEVLDARYYYVKASTISNNHNKAMELAGRRIGSKIFMGGGGGAKIMSE